MKNTSIGFLFLIICGLGFAACESIPGEGGTSTITGKVFVREYSSVGNLLGEYYGEEERVYIVYGSGNTFDDDTRTSFDGSYKFQYLNKGNYRVFAYSRCDTCASGQLAVIQDVEITSSNETLELEDLIVRK